MLRNNDHIRNADYHGLLPFTLGLLTPPVGRARRASCRLHRRHSAASWKEEQTPFTDITMPMTPKRERKAVSPNITPPVLSVLQRTADNAAARRQMFRRFLGENGLNPTTLARKLGLPTPNSFYNFLNGQSLSLSQGLLELIQQHYPTLQIALEPGNRPRLMTCPVVALAATGLEQRCFRSAELPASEVQVPDLLAYPHSELFGVRVNGGGAARFYPHGSILVCVGIAQANRRVSPRSRLVITRRLNDGLEVSIREHRIHSGRAWLWSGSDHPDHQMPLTPNDVAIEGLVLASWQPEPLITSP